MSERTRPIPVTILSGALGAGKTTLLNHLLSEADDAEIAVLINDMGEVNVDAELIAENSDLSIADGTVTELSNGCICCELRGDLERAVVSLARQREFDHLVVESSGISEPAPVARLFTTSSEAAARYDVDALVTVVDAHGFHDAFGDEERAARRGTDPEGTRPLSDLLVEQVETSDLVVLNKCDLVSDSELAVAEELIDALRPGVEIRRTTHGRIDADRLLGRDLYDPMSTLDAAGWQRTLGDDPDGDQGDRRNPDHDHGGDHDHGDDGGHSHPEAMYGVTSFVYRQRRPFHPQRVAATLADLPPSVVRSKGRCWIAGRDVICTFSQAGSSARMEVTGRWIASLPSFEQDAYRANRSDLDWDDQWGDRRTELVFIGTEVEREALVARLDDCLLTDSEMNADWDSFANPFPTEGGEPLVLATPRSDTGEGETGP